MKFYVLIALFAAASATKKITPQNHRQVQLKSNNMLTNQELSQEAQEQLGEYKDELQGFIQSVVTDGMTVDVSTFLEESSYIHSEVYGSPLPNGDHEMLKQAFQKADMDHDGEIKNQIEAEQLMKILKLY